MACELGRMWRYHRPPQQTQHVVIIFQENRTPHNLFHNLPNADIAISGINSHGQTIPLTPVSLAAAYDLDHSHKAFLAYYDNDKMDGADTRPTTCPKNGAFCPANPLFVVAVTGFTGMVAITCPLPFAGTCTATPASIVPTTSGASSTVTVTPSASAAVGTYALTMTGTSGSEKFSVHPSLTVKPPPPDFSISAPTSTTPGSVVPGQSGTAKVTIGSTRGFTGTVTFTCTVSPAPSMAPTCSLAPGQATLTSGGQATSTLTVNTTGLTAFLARPHPGRSSVAIYAIAFPIFGVALAGMGFTSSGRRRRRLLGAAIGFALIAGLILQTACGGGGSSGGGTPAGNYTVTVTGSSASSQHTSPVMLTVQ
jgi:hypothetical protein